MTRPLKSILAFAIAAFTPEYALAQFTDDFSDGNFNMNPAWTSSNTSGNGADFQVTGGVLQSNGPAATATLWISTNQVPVLSAGKTVWTFTAQYGSAPSGSNNIEIFLTSDQADLAQDPTGYYIRLGESGSDDGIDLFKTGSATPLIADPNPSAANTIDVRIRATRDANGTWTLEADKAEGTAYATIGVVTDTEFTAAGYFGVKVKHTSSRSQDYYFDDISLTHEDNVPPEIAAIEVISGTRLILTFSEVVNPATAERIENYLINDGIGHPSTVSIDPSDTRRVQLTLASPLANAVSYELSVSAVEDLKGNPITHASAAFFYFKEEPALAKDIVINEIFSDPDPPNDLPGTEFIELYNNSDKVFDLTGWSFLDFSSTGMLTSFIFRPGEFLILCPEASLDEFTNFGNVMELATWPTLNNSGDALVLKNREGALVDTVNYDATWYNSSSKASGGWSLELIDPNNVCSDQSNWAGSENVSGGTPGRKNSVRTDQPDLTGPGLVEAMAFQPDHISARFNEILDPQNAVTAQYRLDPQVEITNAEIDDNLREVHLTVPGNLEPQKEYTLTVEAITDCNGNLIGDFNMATFHLIEPADSSDIIINEILFNPRSGGVDFVELYNRSTKYINLKDWALANGVKTSSASQIRPITNENVILQPSEYAALTTDPIVLKEQYPFGQAANFLAVTDLPSFPDNAGTVILMQKDSLLVDHFNYSEDYHFDLLTDEEGVSLERISFSAPANKPENWKSAASIPGFATPGYINSQSRTGIRTAEGEITLNPEIIIPDGSGQQDFTTISYAFSQPGYVANARIVDLYGRTIKVLSENDYLPAKGFYTWDATDDDGRKVRIGYYMVYFEVFDLEGHILKFREKVVVGTRF